MEETVFVDEHLKDIEVVVKTDGTIENTEIRINGRKLVLISGFSLSINRKDPLVSLTLTFPAIYEKLLKYTDDKDINELNEITNK